MAVCKIWLIWFNCYAACLWYSKRRCFYVFPDPSQKNAAISTAIFARGNDRFVHAAVARLACHATRCANGRFGEAALQRRGGLRMVTLGRLLHWLCPLITHCTSSSKAQHL